MELFLDLQFWGIVSFLIAVELTINLLGHVKFYFSLWKEKDLDQATKSHALKLCLVVGSVALIVSSIALYGVNWIAFKGDDQFRLFLKLVQISALITLRVSFGGLRSYYKGL